MKLIITTVKRFKDYQNSGSFNGNIHLYDIKKRYSDIVTIPIQCNFKTRSIGFRGLDYYSKDIYTVTSDGRFLVFDSFFNFKDILHFDERLISDCYFSTVDIHQIKEKDGILYCSLTREDKMFMLKDKKWFGVVNLSNLNNRIPDCFKIDKKWGDDYLHFNSIGFHPDTKDMYHIYYNLSMVFNYTKSKVVFSDRSVLRCPHDIEFLDSNNFLVNSSLDGKTYLFTIDGDLISYRCIFSCPVIKHTDLYNENYTRGICVTDDNIFICSSPNYINVLDRKTFMLMDVLTPIMDANEVIFDIMLYRNI